MANQLKFYILLLICALSLTANLVFAEDWYSDPGGSYKMVPPTGWQVVQIKSDFVEFRTRELEQNYRPGIAIMRLATYGIGQIESSLQQKLRESAAAGKSEFRFISEEQREINGASSFLVTYEHTFQNFRMKTVEGRILCKGNGYAIIFNAPVSTFDKYYPAFLRSLETFTPTQVENWNWFVSKTQSENSQWAPYVSIDKTTQVEIPRGWKVNQDKELLIIGLSDGRSYPNISVEKSLILAPHHFDERTLSDLENNVRKQHKKAGDKVISVESTEIDNNTGLKFTIELTDKNGRTIHAMVVEGYSKDYKFGIYCAAPVEEFEFYRSIFERFIQSIHFRQIGGFIQILPSETTPVHQQEIEKQSVVSQGTFRSRDGTFEVIIPSPWTITDKTDVVFFKPSPNDEKLLFYVVKRHKLDISDLKEWEAETRGVFVTDSEKLGYRFSEFKETSVDSRPALRADFQKTGADEKGVVIRVFTRTIDFELYYAAPAKRFEEFLPIFEQFANSFRVLKEKQG